MQEKCLGILLKMQIVSTLNNFDSVCSSGQEIEFLVTIQVNSEIRLKAILKGNTAIKGMKRDTEDGKRQ